MNLLVGLALVGALVIGLVVGAAVGYRMARDEAVELRGLIDSMRGAEEAEQRKSAAQEGLIATLQASTDTAWEANERLNEAAVVLITQRDKMAVAAGFEVVRS